MILNLDTVKSITCGVNRLEETDNGIRFHRMTEEEENYIKNVGSEIQNSELEHALQRLGRAIIANNKK